MKKTASLIPAAILVVCLLWLSLAAAWTLSGFVYIDDSTPAPCVPVHLHSKVISDCGGEIIDSDETAANGYYELSVPQGNDYDTVWVEACLHLVPCLWCMDWDDCYADTICKRATVLDTASGVSFDFEQSSCSCD